MIRNGALVDDFAVLVQNTQGVLLIAEIETDGDGWYFRFHGSEDCITALTRRQSLPSHLILFGKSFQMTAAKPARELPYRNCSYP